MNPKIIIIGAMWMLNGFLLGLIVVGSSIAYHVPDAIRGFGHSFWSRLPILCIILAAGIYSAFRKTGQVMRENSGFQPK